MSKYSEQQVDRHLKNLMHGITVRISTTFSRGGGIDIPAISLLNICKYIDLDFKLARWLSVYVFIRDI